MSIPVLVQVYEEVRRLAIAGSAVAPGDFRLSKLVAPVQQLGQKAPVFTKVAEAMSRLIASDEARSSSALLELSALVSAILYTQGDTGVEGPLEPIESIHLELPKTQASARVLKPLMEALTTTGSGRLEIVKDAHQRGVFRDVRLMASAVRAIDDPFPELAEYVTSEVLPLYGRAIFEPLRDGFDPKSRHSGQARRLGLMMRIDELSTRPIAREVLDHGSKELRVAALGCLGDRAEDLPLLLESVKAKSDDERAAAYRALGRTSAPEAIAALGAAIAKDRNLELAQEVIRQSPNPTLQAQTIEATEQQLARLLALDGKDPALVSLGCQRLNLLLGALRGREDEAAARTLLAVFEHQARLSKLKGQPGGLDLVLNLISVMASAAPAVQSVLVEAVAEVPGAAMGDILRAGAQVCSPEQLYERFSGYLRPPPSKTGKSDPQQVRREAVLLGLSGRSTPWRTFSAAPSLSSQLDPRWIDLAVELKEVGLVGALAQPGHQGAEQLLAATLKARLASNRDGWALYEILEAMVRIGHPEATDLLVKVLEYRARGRQDYSFQWLGQLIPRLPKAEAEPKLDALLPKLPDWMIDQLTDALTELKRAP